MGLRDFLLQGFLLIVEVGRTGSSWTLPPSSSDLSFPTGTVRKETRSPKLIGSSDRSSTFFAWAFRSKDEGTVGQGEDPVVTAVLRRGQGRTQAAWDGDNSSHWSIAHGNMESRKVFTSDEE